MNIQQQVLRFETRELKVRDLLEKIHELLEVRGSGGRSHQNEADSR